MKKLLKMTKENKLCNKKSETEFLPKIPETEKNNIYNNSKKKTKNTKKKENYIKQKLKN